MDVRVLSTFLEVARVRHFGRAADNLHLTQAAVSARIKQLESYFDTQLFTRDRNNIKLTSSGERLISYAEVMVNTLRQAKNELSLESHQALQLTLAGTPNIWDAYLQHSLSELTSSFDTYGFNAEVTVQDQLNRGLMDRTIDIAFAFDPLKAEELECKKVADLTLVLVSTKSQSVEEAFAHGYVYVDWGLAFGAQHAALHKQKVIPSLRTSTGRIALDFILEKGGSAYLPESLVEPFLESGQLVMVGEGHSIVRPFYLTYRKKSSTLAAIKEIEKYILKLPLSTSYVIQHAAESTS